MGAVGDLLVRQLESELAQAREELATLKLAEEIGEAAAASTKAVDAQPLAPAPAPASPPLVKQPALWFAVAGWAVAVVLLFRRRTI